jgi:hypothetical protein
MPSGGAECLTQNLRNADDKETTLLTTTQRRRAETPRLRRSRAPPFVVFCSATFFCARKNVSHFSFSSAKKRQFTAGTVSAALMADTSI